MGWYNRQLYYVKHLPGRLSAICLDGDMATRRLEAADKIYIIIQNFRAGRRVRHTPAKQNIFPLQMVEKRILVLEQRLDLRYTLMECHRNSMR